jgi:hypothetical protein
VKQASFVIGAWLLALAGACRDIPRPPPRPLGVPRTAAWARGLDGAQPAWVDCWRRSDVEQARDRKPHPELDDRFDCEVFDERGAIQRKGAFRLLDEEADGTLVPVRDPRALLSFRGWRGDRLELGPARVLVAERSLRCAAERCVASSPP